MGVYPVVGRSMSGPTGSSWNQQHPDQDLNPPRASRESVSVGPQLGQTGPQNLRPVPFDRFDLPSPPFFLSSRFCRSQSSPRPLFSRWPAPPCRTPLLLRCSSRLRLQTPPLRMRPPRLTPQPPSSRPSGRSCSDWPTNRQPSPVTPESQDPDYHEDGQ